MELITRPLPNSVISDILNYIIEYNAEQTEANWELVKTAFVEGWATQYNEANK